MKRPLLLALLGIFLLAGASIADLSGYLKYGYERDYQDSTQTRSTFTQDYLANLSGPLFKAGIGSYGLGLQYQRGITDLKNLNFTDTINFFNERVKLSTSYFRKEFTGILYDYPTVTDNRYSASLGCYFPSLPSLTFGYETGDSRSATSEGINKYDKKGEIGLNYSIGRNNISARYVRSSLYDDTYLSNSAGFTNRDTLLTVNGNGGLGERALVNTSYSDQLIYSKTGAVTAYNQNLKNITANMGIKLFPFLSLNPEISNSSNLIDYDIPAGQKNEQWIGREGLDAVFQPFGQLEVVAGAGSGKIRINNLGAIEEQGILTQKAGLNVNYAGKLSGSGSIKDEYYSGGRGPGKLRYGNGYITLWFERGVSITFRKNMTSLSGNTLASYAGGIRSQDLNDLLFAIGLPNSLNVEAGYSTSRVDNYNYNGLSGSVRISPTPRSLFEIKREHRFGDEVSQSIVQTTDSLRLSFPLRQLVISEQFYLISNRTVSQGAAVDIYGFRNYTELSYYIGDSTVNMNINSERGDQNSSVYTRTAAYFARNF